LYEVLNAFLSEIRQLKSESRKFYSAAIVDAAFVSAANVGAVNDGAATVAPQKSTPQMSVYHSGLGIIFNILKNTII
jgi:hypothetical protein